MKNLEALKRKENINWINYLVNTQEKNYNIERVKALKEITSKSVYDYVLRSFEVLVELDLAEDVYYYVAETLKWMEVAKTGSKLDRRKWRELGFDLYVHNIGSSQIYVSEEKTPDKVVEILIKTHGLVGQYLRGEVNLDKNIELYYLIRDNLIDKATLREILIALNKCVIKAVSNDLYNEIEEEIIKTIDLIINNNFAKEDLSTRLKRLNKDFDVSYLKNKEVVKALEYLLDTVELWFYESALKGFDFSQKIKILLYISKDCEGCEHLTFEELMKNIYFDYENKKTVNIYKQRVIETLLNDLDVEDILHDTMKTNPHLRFYLRKKGNTLIFNFKFSIQTRKLIEFCEVAYGSGTLYNKSVYLLYDLFEFRRDKFDRFYNEMEYISNMNSSLENKKVLLDFIVGEKVLDVGPGGGALMDLIEEELPYLKVYGIDLAKNVIEILEEKKRKEKRKWNIVEGDALNLTKHFPSESIDTIIYSSIIHELYSYIEYEGKKFNIDTVIKTLKEAYAILSVGGRILIRDGIMTEPKDSMRVIEFFNKEDISILDNYCHDFRGREITYEKLDDNKVKLPVNDAMEFLYTYTWGDKSYAHEVQEQFGYLTPSEYQSLIEENLRNAEIVYLEAFLQGGYEKNLLTKVAIYDEEMNIVKLPDSTCIIVIEKLK